MNYLTKLDKHRLKIFHESKKRRVLVGELIYNKQKNRYELTYDKNYAYSKNAIPNNIINTLYRPYSTQKITK